MPNRPKRTIKRPSWCTEPDYYQRERGRLAIIDDLRAEAIEFAEQIAVCPDCDFPIGQAVLSPDETWRFCHCQFVRLNARMMAEPFTLKGWRHLNDLNQEFADVERRRQAGLN
jgi:hypothetical protein